MFNKKLSPDTNEWLAISLTLKIKGKDYKVAGANIKDVELDCQFHGFAGSLTFWIPEDGERKDELLEPFVKEDLIEVELGIKPVLPPVEVEPDPLVVKGLVTEKSLFEEVYQQTKNIDVYYRRYQIRFADPAQVLWKQHYPCELYVKESMETVFNKQLTPQVQLEMKLPAMKTEHPMICLGLGLADRYNNGAWHQHNTASFYDFVLDYVTSHHAHFQYDYQKHSYLIAEERPRPVKSKDFMFHEIEAVEMHWQSTQRYNTQLLNALADKPKTETVKNTQAVEGIRHDILLREATTSKVTDLTKQATARLKPYDALLEVACKRWPVVTFAPGYAFSVDKKTWGKDPQYLDKKYRAYRIQIHAHSVSDNVEHKIQDKDAGYNLRYQVSLEPEASAYPRLPEPVAAAYPILVEGKVVSTVGSDKDKTYDLEKNQDTQVEQYKVTIPLWDKTILIREQPDAIHPHFYFPHYRDTKLLLALYLHEAHIVKVLDWGARTKLPLNTQGNHVLFGKNDKDETSMSHIYEGDKPTLLIKRVKDKDNEQVKLKEGTLILETNWE